MFSLFTDIQAGIGPAARRVGAVCDSYAMRIIDLLEQINHNVIDEEFIEDRVRFSILDNADRSVTPFVKNLGLVPLDEQWQLESVTYWSQGAAGTLLLSDGRTAPSAPSALDVGAPLFAMNVSFPTTQDSKLLLPAGTDVRVQMSGYTIGGFATLQFKREQMKAKQRAIGQTGVTEPTSNGINREAQAEVQRRFAPHTLVEAISGYDDPMKEKSDSDDD